jgi:hypothetical protein
MLAIENNNFRIYNAQKFLESLLQTQLSINNLYVWIGQTIPWSNDSIPPSPQDTVASRIATYNNMLAIKRVSPSDLVAVIPNYLWVSGTIYTQYYDLGELGSDGIYHDIFDPSITGTPFYVITNQNNVYKCLSNNNGETSTIQPTGTGTFTTFDGYIWKFMFQVSIEDIQQFLIGTTNTTPGWIPIRNINYNDGSLQWLVQATAIQGTIENIQILNGGSGYISAPIVTITGDGTGCTGTANVSGGKVTGINILTKGINYTTSTVTFTGGSGINASAHAIISPPGGHGSNPLYELGAMYVMVNVSFNYDESGKITTNNSYRNYGLLLNPTVSGSTNYFTGLVGTCTTNILLDNISVPFSVNDFVTGAISGATAYVVDYNNTTNILRCLNITGTFQVGETLNDTSTGTIVAIIPPDIQIQSGLILTQENITPIMRSLDQSENISIVLPF